MRNKKIVWSFLSIAMLMSMCVFPTSANNHTDTYYGFSLPHVPYFSVYEDGRLKTDASGSYVYSNPTNPTEGVRFAIFGHSKDYFNNESELRNCTKSTYAIVYNGQKRRIRQYVYEWNYTYAFLGGAGNDDFGFANIQGVWSPDSVGSDPYAN